MFNKEYSGVFRWFKGKRLLSDIRGGDYAHAGEEEAIRKVFAKFTKSNNRQILDVGSGRGGTANFIYKNGWGSVIGIDIEEESVDYSKNKYPGIKFYVCDACDEKALDTLFKGKKFDLIIIFHSLCVFPKQFDTMKALKSLSHDGTELVIFEYEDFTLDNNPLNRTEGVKTYFNVISRQRFKNMLTKAGWCIQDKEILDVTGDFLNWYEGLVRKLELKKETIINNYGNEYYEKATKRYGGMIDAIKQGVLGGCILYASSSS